MDISCLCREWLNLAEFSLAEKVYAADQLFNTTTIYRVQYMVYTTIYNI